MTVRRFDRTVENEDGIVRAIVLRVVLSLVVP